MIYYIMVNFKRLKLLIAKIFKHRFHAKIILGLSIALLLFLLKTAKRWRRNRIKRAQTIDFEKQIARSIIADAELETQFACKVTYLKLRHEMTKMEQDQLYFDTNFDQHMKIYARFRQEVVNCIILRRGLTVTKWEALMLSCSDIKTLYDEKVLFPFVGMVKE